MRYKEGEIPPEAFTHNASDDMLILTAAMGIVIGIIISVLGKVGRQLWMLVWGIGLVTISFYLGISIWFNLDFPY